MLLFYISAILLPTSLSPSQVNVPNVTSLKQKLYPEAERYNIVGVKTQDYFGEIQNIETFHLCECFSATSVNVDRDNIQLKYI